MFESDEKLRVLVDQIPPTPDLLKRLDELNAEQKTIRKLMSLARERDRAAETAHRGGNSCQR